MAAPPILEAHAIRRGNTAHGGWLLDVSELSINAGECLALVGPSGAGKTLLLRALALLDPWDSGALLWHSQPVRGERVPEFRSQVMYLAQRPALLEGTVYDNLQRPFLLRQYRQRSFDQGLIIGWLKQCGRDASFLNKNARDLSGGEGQLVSLLRAIQLSPQVLLLDEPTASMDPETTSAVERLVLDWKAEQPQARSFVWVSHDDEQIARVATRFLRVNAGRLIGDD